MAVFIQNPSDGGNASYFRKKINIAGTPVRARICVSAMGIYKLYVNGTPVDSDILSPGWTDYTKRIPFYRYDVTDRLHPGENVIGTVLGDGWAVGKIAWFGREKYAKNPSLWFELTVTYADGTSETFGSDEGVKVSGGQEKQNDILDGEEIDGREDADGLCVGYADASWANAVVSDVDTGKLGEALVEPIRLHERFDGKFLGKVNGCAVYDFGQNHAGVIRVRFSGAKNGDRVTFRYGEMLDGDGSVYVDNLRSAKCTDTYICSGKDDVFAPWLTYHGYRYVGIGIEGCAEIRNVESYAIYNDIPFFSRFSCSDQNVNRLYRNIVWGQKSNFVTVPTDCPQRDERLGWTGDAEVFAKTAMYQADCRKFYDKYLQDVRDAQTPDGMIQNVAPCVEEFDNVCGAPAWSDVITILPLDMYCFYRDTKILSDNLSAAKRWVDFCLRTSTGYIRRKEWTYGDWLSVGEETDFDVISTLYMAESARRVSVMCGILGDPEEKKYEEIFRNVKDAFLREFVGEDGRIKSDTQTCYLLAYQFGILPAEKIRDHLLRKIRQFDGHLSTGFVGIRYLLPTLCDLGQTDLAYELLTRVDYPSWCYSVVNGATTMWERWNSFSYQDGFADRRMNSFNHYSLGAVGEWMFAYMLGIRTCVDGIFISPSVDFSGRITCAGGETETVYGKVSVAWKVKDGTAYLQVHAPKECRVILPDDDRLVLVETLDGV